MTVNRTTLLDLPLPVTGTESGTWGDTTNNGLTQYLDIAIAGSLVLSADSDTTLSSTEGDSSATNIGGTTAQYAVLRCTGARTATRNINAPAWAISGGTLTNYSKIYIVVNETTGSQNIVLRATNSATPTYTTGVTIVAGERAVCAWNGSDFVKVGGAAGGTNTQVQYNNNGVFGGVSGATTNGTAITFSTTNLKLQGSSTGVSSFASANSSASDYTYTFPAASTTIPVATQTLTFSGPTAARTITLPDANFTAARIDAAQTFTGAQTFNTAIATGSGGTGLSLYTAGDMVYYSTGTTLTKLTIGAANRVMTSSGSAPQWVDSLTGLSSVSSTAFTENGYPVVSQADIGTAPNEIPLNQYLGDLAYQDSTAVTVGSLTASGNIILSTAGAGIDFSATANSSGTMTSELLSDYEEGTWTPTYAATGTGFTTMTMDIRSATYTKIGRQVTVRAWIRTDNVNITGATGDLIISGLPFQSASGDNGWSAVSIGYGAGWASNTPLYGRVGTAQSYMFLCTRATLGSADTVVAFSDMTTGATADKNELIFTTTYFV